MEKQLTEQELENGALDLLETAHGMIVTDEKSYSVGCEFLSSIKKEMSIRKNFFADIKEGAHKAWKGIVAKENESLDPLKEADGIVRKSVGAYLDEQDRIKKEAQKKLEEQARKDAEKERKDLLKRAENVKTESKREELIEKAEDVIEEPVFTDHAVQKTTKLDSGSVTRKKDIVVDIVDPKLILQGIINGEIPMTCVEIKPNKIKSWIKAAGMQEDTIPGCRIRSTSGVSVR